jgi:16S rRNA (cytosine1402-N4)-methyltransferase
MHTPVLLDEVIGYLRPSDGEVYLDCTFGAGNYSRAILDSANCSLIAIDQDPDVEPYSCDLQASYKERFSFYFANFSSLKEIAKDGVDGVVFDLGVSNMQLAQAERGFSFTCNGPLDMRMDKGQLVSETAKSLLLRLTEEELANVIYAYGGEHKSRRIARAVAAQKERINTTFELASIVRQAVGRHKCGKIDAATRTFQALRIAVNQELEAFKAALESVGQVLKPEGRIVIVTFHSLEDKIAKDFLKERSERSVSRSKYARNMEEGSFEYKILTKKPVRPSDEEVERNPGARSAKLRAAVKL